MRIAKAVERQTRREKKSRGSLSVTTLLFCSILLLCGSPSLAADRICLIVTGLGGLPEYEENFSNWGDQIAEVCGKEPGSTVHHLNGRKQKRDEILEIFDQVASAPPRELWVFLIGHANHDGHNYKFNIAGPDLTDQQIGGFLDRVAEARTYIVAATSASGGLAVDLSHTNRVIVTATRGTAERQAPLFMSFFLEAVTSAEADTDKNGKVSLLEAYLFSHNKVGAWFEEKGRIQTEHPVLDDNGQVRLNEKKSEPPEIAPGNYGSFLAALAYLSAPPAQAYRTLEAKGLASVRVEVEREIEDLKFRKKDLSEDDYYNGLEALLVRLAETNERIRQLEGEQ